MEAAEGKKVVEVKDLEISIPMDEGLLTPVRGVSFFINEGEALGIVGESGCGKSLTSKAILGINEKRCRVKGEILFTRDEDTVDLLKLKYGS
ncbi:MAG: ATP-binding cassette domain-containing protein, partial [Treponema sp.]|nr:ATP-binding cassette domain-containing protein [Treponema sp.]